MRLLRFTARGQIGLLAFFVVWLAACSGPVTSAPTVRPAPTDSPAPAETALPLVRPTLPPTWTPTPTWTPLPPSATPTATLPPTLVPTLNAAERCAAFALLGAPVDGLRVTRRAAPGVTFTWSYDQPQGGVILQVTHAASGLGQGLTAPGPVMVALPFRLLSGPGVYHWTVGPLDAEGALLDECAVSGRFTLLAREREARTALSGPAEFDPDPVPTPREPSCLPPRR